MKDQRPRDPAMWVYIQNLKPSSAKALLRLMVDMEDGEHRIVCMEVMLMADLLGQDRKTVLAGIKRLKDLGIIVEGPDRAGATGQIKSYAINYGNVGLQRVDVAKYAECDCGSRRS